MVPAQCRRVKWHRTRASQLSTANIARLEEVKLFFMDTIRPKSKAEYQAYLLTDHWKDFSMNVRAERKNCERCGCSRVDSIAKYQQALHVHHKTYERLGRELPSDVEVLCFHCHLITEHKSDDIAVLTKAFSARFAMPGVEKIRVSIPCANCQKPIQFSCWNADEVPKEELCSECRQ